MCSRASLHPLSSDPCRDWLGLARELPHPPCRVTELWMEESASLFPLLCFPPILFHPLRPYLRGFQFFHLVFFFFYYFSPSLSPSSGRSFSDCPAHNPISAPPGGRSLLSPSRNLGIGQVGIHRPSRPKPSKVLALPLAVLSVVSRPVWSTGCFVLGFLPGGSRRGGRRPQVRERLGGGSNHNKHYISICEIEEGAPYPNPIPTTHPERTKIDQHFMYYCIP